jgi:subtilase family serine protease
MMDLHNHKYANKSVRYGLLLSLLVFQASYVLAQPPHSLTGVAPHERITKKINDVDRVTLGGHRLAQLDASLDEGEVDGNLLLKNMMLVLKSSPKQLAALEAFSKAQQTPGAPEYHRWLTPQEFADHFGVASQDLDAIIKYLVSKGFSIDEIQAGGRSLTFSGTVAQVKKVFHTEIHHFVWQGEQHIANKSDPQIPAALSGVVGGIINLHDFNSRSRKPEHMINRIPTPGNLLSGSINNLPMPDWNIGSNHYLTPADYGVIYDINPLYNASINGSGVNIAVLGRSNIVASDVASFQSFSGLPLNPAHIIINGNDPGLVVDDQFESSLDVEWAAGVAPGATVTFITSASPVNGDGIALSALYAVNNNIGDIISLSYGLCESKMGSSQVSAWGSLWQQAQIQGQTVLVSSGDSGVAGCDVSSNATAVLGAGINGLCSSPYSTCVGGTQFNDTVNPSSYWLAGNPAGGTTTVLGYIPEKVWNESGTAGGSALWASGGGKSLNWLKPSWQVSPGVPADSFRDVPDVSLSASTHDGYLIYVNSLMYASGGTSASTPALAGIIALLEQYNGHEQSLSSSRQGNINPRLYGLYQLQAGGGNYAYFHPTLSGDNSVPGKTGFSATGAGYNQATGLGSVDVNLLVKQWRNLNPSNTSIALSSSASSIVGGQTVTFTATVSGFVPTGSVQFKNNGVTLGTATLNNGVASLTTNALTLPGVNSVVAVYPGDSNNLTSTSSALTESVLTATTITVTVSAASVAAGQSLTLTATVTGVSPTGTVQFYSNGIALGLPVTLVNGIAELTTTEVTTIGQVTITASYSGDSNNAANTSVAINETVTPAQAQQVPALAPWQEALFAAMLFGLMLWIQRRA